MAAIFTCEDGRHDRTIDWVDGEIRIIDQTRLPDELTVLRITALDALIDAIARLAIRGAPALGVAGAMGVTLLAAANPGDERGRPRRCRSPACRAADGRQPRLGHGSRARPAPGRGPAAVLDEALARPGRGRRRCAPRSPRAAPTSSGRWSPDRGSA